MNSIKIILFSFALISSCTLVPSAPAPAHVDDDGLEVQEIPLVPIKYAQEAVDYQAGAVQSFFQRNPNIDKKLIKEMHQAECDINNLFAHTQHAKHDIEACAQKG